MKYKLYQEIEIDNYHIIVEKTLNYVKEKTNLLEEKFGRGWMKLMYDEFVNYVPEVKVAFERYGLKPTQFGLYLTEKYMSEYKVDPIHIDVHRHNARINIPILNVTGSWTEFYTNVNYVQDENPETKVPYYRITNTDYKLVDVLETKTATVFNIKEAHRVVIPDGHPVPRIMLVIATDIDPKFLLEESDKT